MHKKVKILIISFTLSLTTLLSAAALAHPNFIMQKSSPPVMRGDWGYGSGDFLLINGKLFLQINDPVGKFYYEVTLPRFETWQGLTVEATLAALNKIAEEGPLLLSVDVWAAKPVLEEVQNLKTLEWFYAPKLSITDITSERVEGPASETKPKLLLKRVRQSLAFAKKCVELMSAK